MSYLPVELLHKIFRSFDTDNTIQQREDLYLPKDFLLPLLCVCKSWHPVAEYYLYQSISIGSSFFGRDRFTYAHRKRRAHVIAEHLLNALQASPRLAHLIKALRVGIVDDNEIFQTMKHPKFDAYAVRDFDDVILDVKKSWMQTCISILRLCTHVEHIEIRGFWFDPLDILFDGLERESLQSFAIDGKGLYNSEHKDYPRLMGLLLKAMARWPHLKRVSSRGILLGQRNSLAGSDINNNMDPDCVCTEAEEVHFEYTSQYRSGFSLQGGELRALHTLFPNLKKLTLPLTGTGEQLPAEYMHSMTHFMQSWASSLECVMFHCDSNLVYDSEFLLRSLSNFLRLRELHLYRVQWCASALSDFLNLERLVCTRDEAELHNLAVCLNDERNFPALRIVQVMFMIWNNDTDFERDLKTACHQRQIHLSRFIFTAPSPDELVYDPLPGCPRTGDNEASDCKEDFL